MTNDPLKQFSEGLTARGSPIGPNSQFLLGADNIGRDLLSRLIWGGRISLTVSLVANVLSILIAIIVGGAAGFLRGATDTVVMRVVDIALSFPTLVLQIALSTVLPPSIWTVIFVISIFAWAYPARVFRGQILAIRERAFVESARSIGASERRIFIRHVLPQLLPTVVVYFTIRVPSVILTEATLSFLGLGVPPPTPSWGNMILGGSQLYRQAPWVIIFPGLCIMAAVLSFNLLGDGLRDALDPRERRWSDEPIHCPARAVDFPGDVCFDHLYIFLDVHYSRRSRGASGRTDGRRAGDRKYPRLPRAGSADSHSIFHLLGKSVARRFGSLVDVPPSGGGSDAQCAAGVVYARTRRGHCRIAPRRARRHRLRGLSLSLA